MGRTASEIVEGAVGMVKQALAHLDEEDVVELDEERKAAMVSNLLVVLCSDRATQPSGQRRLPLSLILSNSGRCPSARHFC